MIWLLLFGVVVVASKNAAPHYVDGVHNEAYDIEHSENPFATHDCEELKRQHSLRGDRDRDKAAAFAPSEVDEMLRSEIEQLQHPHDCSQARLLLYALHSDCGFGAELHWLTVALYAALQTNRTLVLIENEKWIYAEKWFCPDGSGSFSCYFQPLSSCTARTDVELATLLNGEKLADVPIFTTKKINENAERRVLQYTRDLQKQLDFPFFRSIPTKYGIELGETDVLWFRSILMHYIMQFTPRINAYIDSLRESLGIRAHDLLAVHNRKGDKALGSKINNAEMTPIAFDRVYNLARAVAMRCNFEGVFIATKDPDCLQYIEEQNKLERNRNDLLWIWDNSQPRVEKGWSTYDLIQGQLNRTREALDVLADIALLASMRGFLGTFESNLSRVVAELGFASGEMEFALRLNMSWFVFP